MSYKIKYTDFANKGDIEINDSIVDTTTSLSFPGRNRQGYSIAIGENFLHLLENFASSSEPPNPVEGQIWYDTTQGIEDLKVYDGTDWKLAGSIRKGSDTPSVGILGDLWVDTDNQQLFLYNGSSWVLVGPSFSTGLRTGLVAETVLDSFDLEKVILKTYVNDEVVSIFSVATFIPKVGIEGFVNIKAGVNLSSKSFIANEVNRYYGIAEKADALLVGNTTVAASNFLRKDVSNITDFGFTIRNNQGLSTGQDSQLRISVDAGQIANIYHATPDSAFDIRLKVQGEATTLLRADSAGIVSIGRNNISPDPSVVFDVLGSSRFTDTVKIEGTQDTTSDVTGALRVSGGVTVQKSLRVKENIINDASITGVLTIGKTTADSVIIPESDAAYDVGYIQGENRRRFRNVYAVNFYGDVVGNISGSSGIANRLKDSTLFTIGGQGDITSDGFSFDGSTGGLNKVFEAYVNENFIANKTREEIPLGSDQLLVYRNDGYTSGLRRVFRTDFLKNLPFIPIGTILPWAGNVTSIPAGYLLCDGSEKRIATYQDLFQVIEYTYGSPAGLSGIGTFRLPDLRGKFPLGNHTMDNGDNIDTSLGPVDSNTLAKSGTTASAAGIVGNTSGNYEALIEVKNIPEHKHNFVGDEGTVFYATNNESGPVNDAGTTIGSGPSDPGTGQYINITGNVVRTDPIEPLNLMNPYLTINYIIFTGNL